MSMVDKIPTWRVRGVNVTGIGKETFSGVMKDDVFGLAAEMTYHAVLALFPFLIFLVGLTAIVDDVFGVSNLTDKIVNQAGNVMPPDAQSVLRDFVSGVVGGRGGGYAIVFGLVGALWASSNAFGAAMKALNLAYDAKESRGYIKKKAVALGLTLLVASMLLLGAALLGTGQFVSGGVGSALGWPAGFTALYNALTPIAALFAVAFAVSLLYWIAPNVEHKYQWVTPGSVLFVVAWLIFSIGFAYYLGNFGSYNKVYGSLAAVIIMLIWMYWSNMLLLVGAELDATLARRYDEQYQRDPNVALAGKGRFPPQGRENVQYR